MRPRRPEQLPQPKGNRARVLLFGTAVSKALAQVGITEDRVSAWLGRPCRCGEYRRRMDKLSLWAAAKLTGKTPPDDEEMTRLLGP